LATSALATPYPPSVAEPAKSSLPDTFVWTPKAPGGGNYMPSRTSSKASRTVGHAPRIAAAVEKARRATGETVSNSNVARYDNSNINDGVGDGTDSYTLYLGDGSTGAGWPAQSEWVSFENM
jgi:hypothetical protein